MLSNTKRTNKNDLVRMPWAKDYLPGEPGYVEMEKHNKLLRIADPEGHLFVAFAKAGKHNLGTRGRSERKSWLCVFMLGNEPGSATFVRTLHDETQPDCPPVMQITPHQLGFLCGMNREKMTPEEFEKFKAKAERAFEEAYGKRMESQLSDFEAQFADRLDHAVRNPVSQRFVKENFVAKEDVDRLVQEQVQKILKEHNVSAGGVITPKENDQTPPPNTENKTPENPPTEPQQQNQGGGKGNKK